MKSTTHRTALLTAAAVTILLTLNACSPAEGEGAATTDGRPTPTGAPEETTTSSPPTSTASTTGPTTPVSSTNDRAEGSGCTPGAEELPDGEWFGYVVANREEELEFDLACWFTGDAAVEAATEDGAESPPPNDYYVRNGNTRVRTLTVEEEAPVVWFPDFGDPTSEATVSYSEWLELSDERSFRPGVWLVVEGGTVASVEEQWTP